MGLIQTDQTQKLRVIDGGHSHKAGNAGFFIGAVQLLAGAALTAHPIAPDLGIAPAAVLHHGLHHAAHDLGGLRPDDLPPAHRVDVLQYAAVRVQDVADEIGLHELSAVHHGAHGCGHFHVGDLAALAKGTGRQLHRAHAVGGVVQALFRLGGQVDAGGLPQTKGGEIIAEGFLAQPGTDLDKALVAGVFQRLRYGLAAVALVIGTVEPGACHRDGVPAVKGGMGAHSPGIQRGGAGDELEHAARLVQVADGFVAPLGLLGQLQCRRALFAGERVHPLPGGVVVNDAGLVGVVGRGGGHGQNRPGVHVHHDAHSPCRHMVLPDGIGQGVFEVVLDAGIDGQPQAAAFQRHPLGLVALFQRIAPCVHGGEHHTVLPGEHLVVLELQPAHTGVVYVGKAQHACQKLPLRIPAFGVLIDADAGDAVCFAEVPHPVGGVPLHTVAQQAVVGAAVAELFQ